MNIFFSFNSNDSYYQHQAQGLAQSLAHLGLDYEIQEIDIPSNLEWPDVCRMKIGMLLEFYEKNKGKKVFWIDADCRLSNLPDFVSDFSSDVIGFQRGFGHPLNIGYQTKSRFWEPCFIGFNSTEGAYQFLKRASQLENRFTGRATDDYFFEESWRELCGELSYQLIPSGFAELPGRLKRDGGVEPFFHFGSSGNVKKYVDIVDQHKVTWIKQTPRYLVGLDKVEKKITSLVKSNRDKLLSAGRRHTPRALKEIVHKRATGQDFLSLSGYKKRIMAAARAGDGATIESVVKNIGGFESLAVAEQLALHQAYALLYYTRKKQKLDERDPLPLVWWYQPAPGNFGDWLSPYIFSRISNRALVLVRPEEAKSSQDCHYFSVGSIGKFVGPNSVVLGTGVSASDAELDPRAEYLMVRGPITRSLVVESGGVCPEVYGDPALALPMLYSPETQEKKVGKYLLVRHFCHADLSVNLGRHIEEMPILVSHANEIEQLIDALHRFEGVVTSAMHCQIVCQVYGIPSVLVTFEGAEDAVHGDGIKYLDYQRGAEVPEIAPRVIALDLAGLDLERVLNHDFVSRTVIERVHATLTKELGAEV